MNLYKTFFLVSFLCAGISCMAAPSHYADKADRIVTDSCTKNDEIEKIISDAISLGAPIYNEGLHMACYRIYEWAAYKIIYVYGSACRNVEAILKTAVEKSHGDYSDIERAWLMRQAFDKILGVPTRTNGNEKESPLQKG